jgi:hypothetical protein
MALVSTYVSEEYIASIVRVTRISELGEILAVTSKSWKPLIDSLKTLGT